MIINNWQLVVQLSETMESSCHGKHTNIRTR